MIGANRNTRIASAAFMYSMVHLPTTQKSTHWKSYLQKLKYINMMQSHNSNFLHASAEVR